MTNGLYHCEYEYPNDSNDWKKFVTRFPMIPMVGISKMTKWFNRDSIKQEHCEVENR